MSILQTLNFDTLNTGVAALTLSVSSAFNRVVAMTISHEQAATGRQIDSLALGGATAFRRGYEVHGSGAAYAYQETWYVLEADIASIGTNPNLTVTSAAGVASTHSLYSGTLYVLDNVDQTPSNWTVASDLDTTVNALSTTITTVADAIVLGGFSCTSGAASVTVNTPLTEATSADRGFNGGSTRTTSFYHTATTTSTAVGGDVNSSSGTTYQVLHAVAFMPIAATATLSSATPSGTIGTQGQASVGATTNQNTGTLYAVISATQGDITGITATQVKTALYAGGGAATFAGNAAVSTTSPSVTITGLTANTLYYFALVQNNTSGDSNVITGSFTTAAATTTVTQQMYAADGVTPLNAVTRRFWTKATLYGAAYDGGTSGLAITCNSSGQFVLTGLTVPAGGGWLTYHDPADNTKSINIPVTFVAGA